MTFARRKIELVENAENKNRMKIKLLLIAVGLYIFELVQTDRFAVTFARRTFIFYFLLFFILK